MMIVLGEAMRFVPDVLEEAKSEGPAAEHDRAGTSGKEEFLLALGE
jgi:hypothetical protein